MAVPKAAMDENRPFRTLIREVGPPWERRSIGFRPMPEAPDDPRDFQLDAGLLLPHRLRHRPSFFGADDVGEHGITAEMTGFSGKRTPKKHGT